MNIELQRVTIAEKSILRNLVHLCMHDYSEFDQFEIGLDGMFAYRWFEAYFQEKERHAYLISINKNLAGFVMVRMNPGNEDWDYQIAEFFILRRYRRLGIGTLVSQQLLNKYTGLWEISYSASNQAASKLWNSILKDYPNKQHQVDFGEKGRNRFLIETGSASKSNF